MNVFSQESLTVTDIDGNRYKTIAIGPYRWMAENLRTTHYRDGEEILKVTDDSLWVKLESAAFSWYNNNDSNAQIYGALYNWYAVNTDKLCPENWRVPSDDECKYLEGFADSRYNIGDVIWDTVRNRGFDAGLRLKSIWGWKRDGNGNDAFGFSAFPGGERCSRARFFQQNISGFWWTCTEFNESRAWYRNLFYDYELIFRESHPKYFGFSVRCISNNKQNINN